MAERTGEFNEIDLDEDEDNAQPGSGEEERLDPIDFDNDDDDENDDEDENEDIDADEDADAAGRVEAEGDVESPRVSISDAELDEEEEEAGNVRDGIQRAAAVLKYIVEHIVDEPDAISIGATTDDRGPVLLLRVAEDDRGKVIGRQGRIVQAIRTVVKAATIGTGERVSVEIID